jgi:hypothetical protein
MNINAPVTEPITSPMSPGWQSWFQQATDAAQGWTKSYTTQKPLDFPSVPAQQQRTLDIPAAPVTPGAVVLVAPLVPVAGIIFTGQVSTAGVLTIVASNITAGAINPPATDFRVIILQN